MSQWKKKVDNSGLSREEIASAYERVEQLDIRTPLSIQLRWLEEIGFVEVDCLYKYYDFSVLWALKAD